MMKNSILLALILLCVFAFSDDDKRKVVLTPKAPAPIGPYSQAIRAGELLYVSGQIALHSDGSLDSSSIENECRRVLENIKAIVEAGGKNMQSICKTTIYLTDLKQFQKVNGVYATYFPKDPPARETVEVRALPKGAHVEISAIAN